MKNLLRSGAFVFLFSLLITTPTFAATSINNQETGKSTVLSTLQIQDVSLSQDNNVFKISFYLNNKEITQTDVKYSVSLIKNTKTDQFIADEKVYDESLTILENSSTKKEIVYTAPANLDGKYNLILTSKNTNGFPLSVIFVKEVTLSASTKGLSILPESCYLTVSGEKDKKYSLNQGVDIDQSENLSLNCKATNTLSSEIKAIPSFKTTYRTSFGEVVPQTEVVNKEISFAPGEEKLFSVILPKAEKPQAYNVNFSFSNLKSNSIDVHYVLNGASATIQNLSFDKDFYANGSTANLAVIVSGRADNFPNSRASQKEKVNQSSLILSGVLTNGSNEKCSDPINLKLDGSSINIPVSVTSDCLNPKISLKVTDENGNILDTKEFSIKTISKVEQNKLPSSGQTGHTGYVIIIIVIIIIIGLIIYFKKKKKTDGTDINNSGGNITGTMVVVLILALGLVGIYSVNINKVNAGTIQLGNQGLNTIFVVTGIDKSAYNVGDPISVTNTTYTAVTGAASYSNDIISLYVEASVNKIDPVKQPPGPLGVYSPFEGIGDSVSVNGTIHLNGASPVTGQTYITGGGLIMYGSEILVATNQYPSSNHVSIYVVDHDSTLPDNPRLSNGCDNVPVIDPNCKKWEFEYEEIPYTIGITPPTVDVSASSNSITHGSGVNISWKSQNASSCSCTYTSNLGTGSCGMSTSADNNKSKNASGNPYYLDANTKFNVVCNN